VRLVVDRPCTGCVVARGLFGGRKDLATRRLRTAAFQVGDQPRELTEAFGERVWLTFYRRRPAAVAALMGEAGLNLHAQLVREPDDDGFESTPQAYLIGRKQAL
jgi:hypothetical protein